MLPADFKQVLGQRGSKGPAPPSKLTAHQTQIMKALIEAHADDVQVYSTSCCQCRPSAVCTLSVRSVQSVQTLSQYTSCLVMLALLHACRSSDCRSHLYLLVHNVHRQPAVCDVSQLACQLHRLLSAPGQVIIAHMHCSYTDSSFLQMLCTRACMVHSFSCKTMLVFKCWQCVN